MPPKGKQATKGQKQIQEENQSTLKFYMYIIFGINAAYIVLQYIFFYDSFTALYIYALFSGSSLRGFAHFLASIYRSRYLVSGSKWLGITLLDWKIQHQKYHLPVIRISESHYLFRLGFGMQFRKRIIIATEHTLFLWAVGVNFGSYKFMSSMASGGIDLNMEAGMAEHAKDVILVTCIVQSVSLISNYFWLLWLLVPGRAFYLLWVNILAPWIFAEAPEVDEKKQKKMERKMRRH